MDIKNNHVGIAAVVAIISVTAGMGIAWGTYSNRMEQIEANIVSQQKQLAEQGRDIQQNQRAIDRNDVQYTEILRRLGVIESAVKQETR